MFARLKLLLPNYYFLKMVQCDERKDQIPIRKKHICCYHVSKQLFETPGILLTHELLYQFSFRIYQSQYLPGDLLSLILMFLSKPKHHFQGRNIHKPAPFFYTTLIH